MAAIRPFRALRPARRAAGLVRSPTTSSAPKRRASWPPAIRSVSSTSPAPRSICRPAPIRTPAEVYGKARENSAALRAAPAGGRTRRRRSTSTGCGWASHEQTGIAGCFSIDEYERDLIKKHERTRRDKEDDRTRHMIELRAQTGVGVPDLSRRRRDRSRSQQASPPGRRSTTSPRPTACITRSGRRGAEETNALVDAFARDSGAVHCRRPSSRGERGAGARASCAGRGARRGGRPFIAVAFPDDQMQILPYNRTVKDLAAQTPDAVPRARCGSACRSTTGAADAARQGEVVDVPGRQVVHARRSARATPADASRAARSTSRACSTACSSRCCGSATSAPTSGSTSSAAPAAPRRSSRRWTRGKAAVAFSMYPVTVDDLMAISDAGGIMPPKSTWFEPKLRDGLLDSSRSDADRRPDREAMHMSVLIADKFEQSGIDGLKAAGCDVALRAGPEGRGADRGDRGERRRRAGGARHARSPSRCSTPGGSSLIVRAGAGYNTIDVAGASTRGIYVSNCPGKNAIAVAELAFGADAGARSPHPRQRRRPARRAPGTRRNTRRRAGSTARRSALLGVGSIGQEMIRRAAGFGMNVVDLEPAVRRPGPADDGRRGARAGRRRRAAAGRDPARRRRPATPRARADVLSLHVALGPETRHLVNAALLGAAEAGRDAHQHRARRGDGPRGAGGGGPREGAAGRARRVRQRAGGGDRRRSRDPIVVAARRLRHAPHRRARPTRRRRRSPRRRSASSAATRRPAASPTS